MKRRPQYMSLPERLTHRRLEDVVGCKWSSAVLASIARGVKRPGALERYIPGISKKILNERLKKLQAFGLITRTEFSGERLPHVEYNLTPAGRKLARILDQLQSLQRQLEKAAPPS
ncbi:MAG: helix-turn-helix transcriptional regulator [Verrucomicrobiae bacterium]|nr:helix-turn-helix transcriptional regulator [Verrucomicrobiae bacterium]